MAKSNLTPKTKAVVSIDNVTGGYGDTQILNGINMAVHPDEIVVIVGPNGAGKSTAMKSVFGLLNITDGQVMLDGQNITNMPPEQVVRAGIAFVPQVGNVFADMSVEENLQMGAYIRDDDYTARMQEIYDLFPALYDKRKAPAGSLSGGQRQMVAMGKAMMINPKVMLLDEPTAGLSPKFQQEIFSIVQTVRDAGVPILMVEQNAKPALRIADRAYVLVDGKNAYHDTGINLLNNPEVAEMFLGGHAPEPKKSPAKKTKKAKSKKAKSKTAKSKTTKKGA